MKTFNYLTIIFLCSLIFSCGSNPSHIKKDFIIKTNAEKGNIANNETLILSIENKKNHNIDSISYTLNGNRIKNSTTLNKFKLGKQTIEANVYFNNEKETIKTQITILNNETPKIYKYKIVNEYPHDITSYTQGLEFYKNNLYESTGLYKKSKLRHVDYKTGAIIRNIDLDNEYFGEGLTILNDKIYQLTWKKGTGCMM